jgi:hypothetical protein
VRNRWLSGRAVRLHVGVIVLVAACLGAGWWQITRALSGNGLSWFYSLEWPVIAVLCIGGWWHLIHEDPEVRKARLARPAEWDADPYRAEP